MIKFTTLLPFAFFRLILSDCVDRQLGILTSKDEMQNHGWKINVAHFNTGWGKDCSEHLLYGFKKGNDMGSMSARFEGSGFANLTFGNCYYEGTVTIYLNGKPVESAGRKKNKNCIISVY